MKKVISIVAAIAMACFMLISTGCAANTGNLTPDRVSVRNPGAVTRRVGHTTNRAGHTTAVRHNAANRTTAHTDVRGNVRNISLSQYDRINNGMTYNEVRDIFGYEGVKRMNNGREVYSWDGLHNANADFYFENGVLMEKNHTGLR